MPTFVLVLDYTDEGRKNLGQTLERARDFARLAETRGAEILGQYWTTGPHDGMVLLTAPDGEVAANLAFSLGLGGSVKTHLSRAFTRQEVEGVIPV